MALLKALVIFLIALIPAACALLLMRKAESQARERLRGALRSPTGYGRPRRTLLPDHQYVEGMGYLMGDLSCRWNARSSYLRCAVNPEGPCQNCGHYEAREFADERSPNANSADEGRPNANAPDDGRRDERGPRTNADEHRGLPM